jgi:hypothetical protein
MIVQLDGSHHDWFEGRRAKAVLMVMVDDATNQGRSSSRKRRPGPAITCSRGACGGLDRRRACMWTGTASTGVKGWTAWRNNWPAERRRRSLAGRWSSWGGELILADSPQAKGRVERINGVLQDRLVKSLRLEGIRELGRANEYLAQRFLPALNRRFQREAASPADVHRGVPRDLDEVLSWEEERVVHRDWTVACGGRWHQVERRHEPLSLAGKKVVVRTLRDGRVQLAHRGQKLCWRALPKRPQRSVVKHKARGPRAVVKPAAEHPWRQLGVGVGREYWRGVRAHGRVKRAAIRLAARDSGRPPLRSGLPTSLAPSRGNRSTNNNPRRGHFLVS